MKVTVRALTEAWEPLQKTTILCYDADTRLPIAEQTTDLGGICEFDGLDDEGRFIFRPKVTRFLARLQLLNVIGDFWTIGDGAFTDSRVWHLIEDVWTEVDNPVGNYGVFLHVAPQGETYEICCVDFNGLNNVYVSNDGGTSWLDRAIDMPASGFPSMFRRDIDGNYWVGYEDYPVYSGGALEAFAQQVLVDESFGNEGEPISFDNPIAGDPGLAVWVSRTASGTPPTLGGDLTWELVFEGETNLPGGDPLYIFQAPIEAGSPATIAFTSSADGDAFYVGTRQRDQILMYVFKSAIGIELTDSVTAHFSDTILPSAVSADVVAPSFSVISYGYQPPGVIGAPEYTPSSDWTVLRQQADDLGVTTGGAFWSVAWGLHPESLTWTNIGDSETQDNADEVLVQTFEILLEATVGDGGHLLKSTDQGQNWDVKFGFSVGGEDQKITFRFHDILVHPSNTNRVCIAWSRRDPRDSTADETLYLSTTQNGGTTWVIQEIENVGNGGGSPSAYLAWHRNTIVCVLTAHNGSVDVFRSLVGSFSGSFGASTLFKTTTVDGGIHHDKGGLWSNGVNLYFVPRYFSDDPNEVYRSANGRVWTTLNGPDAGTTSFQFTVNWDRSRGRLGVVYGSAGAFTLWYLPGADNVVAGEEEWVQDEGFPPDGEELVVSMAR